MLRDIVFAGGCFWGVQEYFSRIPGVAATTVGYAQSKTASPSYEQVCSGETGAAEAVRVRYDPGRVSLATLVRQYFKIIDPLSRNRQGNDVGTQYRTGIYYENEDDAPQLAEMMERERQKYGFPLAVEFMPLRNFYPAEEYHQDYLKKNPGGYCHISFESLKDLPGQPTTGAWKSYQRPDDSVLRGRLAPETYMVTRQNGTEPPFSGKYWKFDKPGIYVDAVSGEPLFSSSQKFDSGCGWPSFSAPVSEDALRKKIDLSAGMRRTEVRSGIGDSHLGHVFNDGPAEKGGLRYCINSAALRFIPLENMEKEGYGEYMRFVITE